jgi:hypothetical protein
MPRFPPRPGARRPSPPCIPSAPLRRVFTIAPPPASSMIGIGCLQPTTARAAVDSARQPPPAPTRPAPPGPPRRSTTAAARSSSRPAAATPPSPGRRSEPLEQPGTGDDSSRRGAGNAAGAEARSLGTPHSQVIARSQLAGAATPAAPANPPTSGQPCHRHPCAGVRRGRLGDHAADLALARSGPPATAPVRSDRPLAGSS